MLPTILIRIQEDGDRQTVLLFESDDSDKWLTTPVASGELPRLAPPDLGPRVDGGDEFDAIRAFLLKPDDPEGFARIGSHLHALLDAGDVGRRWRARTGSDPVRVMLDVRAPKLQRLPWELLFSAPKWFGIDPNRPLMRVTGAFPGPGEIQPVRWPLRVLVVVGSKPEDKVVDAGKEIRQLAEAFRRMSGMVDVEFLHQPSRMEIHDTHTEFRPHIFHFIGHGDVTDGRAELLLHNRDTGRLDPWTAEMIDSDLSRWHPRLAILNACRTDSVEAQDGAWSIARLFDRLGVPAVIAMQADIRGDAAADFTGSLYQSLARDEPLDVAVAQGRAAIERRLGTKERDFALPSLTISAPPENLLRMCFGVSAAHRRQVEYLRRDWAGFADRTSERRRLLPAVDPDPEAAAGNGHVSAGGIAITGKGSVGKSELARWCVAACTLHGGNAAYVNLNRGSTLTFQRTLEVIGEELSDVPVHGPENAQAITEWQGQIERLKLGAPDAPPTALRSAFTYFSDALKAAAGGRLLLIVLDDVHNVQEDDWKLISQYLLVPIARERLAPVRVIVVMSDDHPVPISSELQAAIDPIELSTFTPEEFALVAAEYLRHRFDMGFDFVSESVEVLQRHFPRPEFTWEDVKLVHSICQKSSDWKPF